MEFNMPIYEYRCDNCGEHLEALQRMSDPALTVCKNCGAEALQKVMSQTSFVLKGTGWYATDYKSKPAPSESSGAKTSGSEGGSASAESKPSAPASKATEA